MPRMTESVVAKQLRPPIWRLWKATTPETDGAIWKTPRGRLTPPVGPDVAVKAGEPLRDTNTRGLSTQMDSPKFDRPSTTMTSPGWAAAMAAESELIPGTQLVGALCAPACGARPMMPRTSAVLPAAAVTFEKHEILMDPPPQRASTPTPLACEGGVLGRRG